MINMTISESQRRYKLKNKKKISKQNKTWYQNNKERHKKTNRDYYKRNIEKIRIRNKANRLKNRDQRIAYGKARRLRIRLLVINHYSKGKNECSCCKENEMAFLTLDHINNNGNKHREISKNNLYEYLIRCKLPKGLRVLCFNCNSGREKSPGKICPHELKRKKK